MAIRLNSEKIALRRKLKGWSMAKLAAIVGISPNTISELESNERQPREDTVKRIADALGLDIAELYEIVADPAREAESVEVAS
jgi:transcriptional regulator with XRE-family HTH domain